jgi:predicted CDP-diglyceride synthetase/phosphatidate cytidylyltransferase
MPVSQKIGGLFLAKIFDLHPVAAALIVIFADFLVTLIFMYLEGVPPWQRHLYNSFLYNDTIFIPLYCAIVIFILRGTKLSGSFYTQKWWHALLLIIAFSASVLLEINAIRTGQYSIAQEMSPSKLWHTFIFGVVGYWLMAPIIPMFMTRASPRAIFGLSIAVIGFSCNVYLDVTNNKKFTNTHLEGTYVPWMWHVRH